MIASHPTRYTRAEHVEQLVEVIRRQPDGTWARYEARRGGAARLLSLDCELPVDEVYRDPLAAS